jgi:hypothetical protein
VAGSVTGGVDCATDGVSDYGASLRSRLSDPQPDNINMTLLPVNILLNNIFSYPVVWLQTSMAKCNKRWFEYNLTSSCVIETDSNNYYQLKGIYFNT